MEAPPRTVVQGAAEDIAAVSPQRVEPDAAELPRVELPPAEMPRVELLRVKLPQADQPHPEQPQPVRLPPSPFDQLRIARRSANPLPIEHHNSHRIPYPSPLLKQNSFQRRTGSVSRSCGVEASPFSVGHCRRAPMCVLDGPDRLLRLDRLEPAHQRCKECTHRLSQTWLEGREFRTSRICLILSLPLRLPRWRNLPLPRPVPRPLSGMAGKSQFDPVALDRSAWFGSAK